MLSSEKRSELKRYLINEKKRTEALLEVNDNFDLNKAHYKESLGELSTYDNHPADEGTALYEREKDIALEEHAKLGLGNINHAITAIEIGTYGKCEICGTEIPIERLEALPTTTFCIKHSPDQHVSHDRPIEEEVLSPPFGKFDMDDKNEDVAFDAEDSWQAVAQWGTSETPSDFAYPQSHYKDVYIESDENIGYVEDYENFVGNDIYGNNITIYPNSQHELYEQALDEEGIMTTFGDLPAFEHDPYVDKELDH